MDKDKYLNPKFSYALKDIATWMGIFENPFDNHGDDIYYHKIPSKPSLKSSPNKILHLPITSTAHTPNDPQHSIKFPPTMPPSLTGVGRLPAKESKGMPVSLENVQKSDINGDRRR